VTLDRVMAAIDAFAGGTPQFDDITLLVARRALR
jgi:serine phosphatase RsbU (regulator of sigma subunit)